MADLRRVAVIAAAFIVVALAGCDSMSRAGVGADARRELAYGRDASVAWLAEARGGEVGETAAVAAAYLERLRLGLGSPFRLTEFALNDPRLDEPTRRRLAWALLGRTLDGQAYQLDARALDRIGLAGQETAPGTGAHHVQLIENAVRESRDPRGGELAVRLGYTLAAAEGSIGTRASPVAAKAAALVRDRELARADVLRLLRAAEQKGVDPLALLAAWRAERRFDVERPVLGELAQEVEREAMEVAPRLAQALRTLTPKLEGAERGPSPAAPSLLGRGAAERLRASADALNMPPQTPIVIASRMYRRELTEHPTLTAAQRAERDRFVDAATSEERFAAEYALLGPQSARDVAPQLVALYASVALRAYAQEPIWFPGHAGPSSRELEERFGLASVRFADDVPSEWRPYYRRMLESALLDLYRVLPSLDLRGLQVRFDETGSQHASLALHDPRLRRIVLPPATAAGTIAHELAHDLDWQVARRRYRVRGDYATDYAVRLQQDRLAVWLGNLSIASLGTFTQGGEQIDAHWRRPAEIFARSIDWFVAVSLAAEGRTNGYLSSVQDDLLTGYGTVRPPDITGAAGSALLSILDEVAPIYPATREAFLRSYGTSRAVTPYDLLRGIAEAPVPPAAKPFAGRAPESIAPSRLVLADTTADGEMMWMAATAAMIAPLRDVESALQRGFAAIDEWMCRAPGAAYNAQLEAARRRLVVEASAARARGVAIAQAREVAGRAGERWVARRFYGAPWSDPGLDPALAELLEPLVAAARDIGSIETPAPREWFGLAAPPSHCAATTLHLTLPRP
jgi:hypothetical protein